MYTDSLPARESSPMDWKSPLVLGTTWKGKGTTAWHNHIQDSNTHDQRLPHHHFHDQQHSEDYTTPTQLGSPPPTSEITTPTHQDLPGPHIPARPSLTPTPCAYLGEHEHVEEVEHQSHSCLRQGV